MSVYKESINREIIHILYLSRHITSEDAAIAFLQEREVLPKERTCCGEAMKLMNGKKRRFRCRRCLKDISLKTGTFFEGSHLPFATAILFIYAWAKEYLTWNFCSQELGIGSLSTFVDWTHFLREACTFKLLKEPAQTGGPGKTVEIDETLVARRKYNRGRVINQIWVFGGICRETGECFLYRVENRTAVLLEKSIRYAIKEGNTIISNCWTGYSGNENMSRCYTHLTVNHSENFVDPVTGAYTNTVEGMWSQAIRKFKKMNKIIAESQATKQ